MSEFSALLPVYAGDQPHFFSRAIQSVTIDQHVQPTELVIVCDGPLGPGLRSVLQQARNGDLTGAVPVNVIELPRNVGLAGALQAGLAACRFEIVARADADDVSLPHRFAVQVPLVDAGLDLLSSAVAEFQDDESRPGLVRAWPTQSSSISALARIVDPFNHPAVVYRRNAVVTAGGYEDLHRMEDYWLFVRMIAAGARVANVAEPLVLYRVGAGAYRRRGGVRMLSSELRLQWRMLRTGFTTTPQFFRNVLLRGVWRAIPAATRRPLYAIATRARRSEPPGCGVEETWPTVRDHPQRKGNT